MEKVDRGVRMIDIIAWDHIVGASEPSITPSMKLPSPGTLSPGRDDISEGCEVEVVMDLGHSTGIHDCVVH